MKNELKRFLRSIAVLLLMALAILRPEDIGGYDGFLPSSVLPGWAIDGLAIGWWYALAWTITVGLELFLWSRIFGGGTGGIPRQRKLLTDMLNIIIYIIFTGVIAVHIFKQPVTGLFATSGILVIVLGLALQNTLGDLFAGLALNLERPFKAGDWITLDGGIQGFVLITNWRATHVRTRTGDEMIIPNGMVARSRLTNHALPSKLHLANVEIPLTYGFDDAQVEAALRAAAASVSGVLTDPAPIILMHEMKPDVVIWRLYFFIDDFARLVVLRGHLSRAVYATLRAEPTRAFLPRHDIWLHRVDPPAEPPQA